MSDFIHPCAGARLTSPFGYRTIHGKREKHVGVDLAKAGTIPIQASAAGKVIRTGPLGTYGNIVIIQHTIKGKRMDSLYAHLRNSSIEVKVGDKVSQGQRIAFMGNTDGGSGRSTGQHLHFEIHNGPWVTGRPNAIDPLPFITVKEQSAPKVEVKEDEDLKFSSVSLKNKVNLVLESKETQKKLIKDGVAIGAFSSVWADSYKKGTITNGDWIGLQMMYLETKGE